MEFFQTFQRLSKDERAKIFESMSDEQKENFKDLQAEYERLRQLEIEKALAEARRLAIEKLRLKLEAEQKEAYMKYMQLERNLLNYNQQISRAFVYSYYDVIGWLNPVDSTKETRRMVESL